MAKKKKPLLHMRGNLGVILEELISWTKMSPIHVAHWKLRDVFRSVCSVFNTNLQIDPTHLSCCLCSPQHQIFHHQNNRHL
ncbi:unnamed protein product [Arabidopsis thaliana]|uniref:(thale cress) hypothetical protein n=1 Tax=Arabidopsis thaliana TaxID=3702 RepID=A0A7G2E1Z7_ARATH|nr:unnamed protein product [Arabidopsis thaliana]